MCKNWLSEQLCGNRVQLYRMGALDEYDRPDELALTVMGAAYSACLYQELSDIDQDASIICSELETLVGSQDLYAIPMYLVRCCQTVGKVPPEILFDFAMRRDVLELFVKVFVHNFKYLVASDGW